MFLSRVLEYLSQFLHGLSLLLMVELAMNVNGLLMDPVGTLLMILPQILALVNTLVDAISAQMMILMQSMMTGVNTDPTSMTSAMTDDMS